MTTIISRPAGKKAQLQAHLRGVESALRNGDMPAATRLSAAAVAKGFEHARLLALAAYHEIQAGAPEKALECATRARALAPDDIDVLNAIGNCLLQLQRHREAVEAFDAALSRSPDAYLVRFNKASALEALQELANAKAEYERILNKQPSHTETLSRLAHLAEHRGDLPAARTLCETVLRADARHSATLITLATVEIGERSFESALRRMAALIQRSDLSAKDRSIAQGLMGDAFDGLERTSDAFRAYTASQSTRRAMSRVTFERPDAESSSTLVARLAAYFRDAPGELRRVRRPQSETGVNHVFLVGFPRSGTTLLEQILASHPDVDVMSERNCLTEAQNKFTIPSDGLEHLARMDDDDLEPYRQAYWSCVAEEGATPRRAVFVDKMPFYVVFLCLVARLFPDAKIVFAIRDPRDVVLSCFRRRFVMTQQIYELTSLASAAAYYDGVMRLSEIYREKLDLAICDIRQEDVVNDFEAATRGLCEFLALPWSASMKDFARTSRGGSVNTPSGPQLARGLSSQGIGQWLRYREELESVLPTLAPWVTRFGYAEN